METLLEAVEVEVGTNVSCESSVPVVEAAQNVQAEEIASSSTRRPSMVGGTAEYDEWRRTGWSLRAECEKNEGGIAWQAARWLVNGYRTFLGPNSSNREKGELISLANSHSGLSRNTLIAYIKVGLAYPDGPILGLSFAHHRAVTSIPNSVDRDYWLRQAAKKEMSVAILKKAIAAAGVIPVKEKVGIDVEQEVERYMARMSKLNPKDGIWNRIMSDVQSTGRRGNTYALFRRDMNWCAETLCRNLRHLDAALAGQPVEAVAQAIQERIKPSELVEAEKMEAIGSAIGVAA
jgi:hypothetical protein